MYTNEDLNFAVDEGIFSQESVDTFREKIATSKKTYRIDEEDIKLVSSFNDIFVVIACALLLFSSLWAVRLVDHDAGNIVFVVLSWLLAEFFILKRKMALPAMLLLIAFVGGVFNFVVQLNGEASEVGLMMAAGAASISAYAHWRRFKVPITIAAGSAALVAFSATIMLSINPELKGFILPLLFMCGLAVFVFAMVWDASDTTRTSNKSDVAFWLHLLSAPLIIHPIFMGLGIFDGNETLATMLVVIALYVFMTILSITVDRRAFMVSSLAYVVYAISNILKEIGGLSYSLAFTGMFIGSALLILSAYWHIVRVKLVGVFPVSIQKFVPPISH